MADSYVDMLGKNSGYIEQALPINVYAAVPAGVQSGDVVLLGGMICYAQTDRNTAGYATVTTPCVHVQKISVVGKDGAGNVAVGFGDRLYYDNAVPEVNKDVTNGILFGYAFGTVGSGLTAEISVGFGT